MALLLLALLTISMSYIMEFYSIRSALPAILTEIRSKNAARFLSAAYKKEEGWELIEGESSLIESLEEAGSQGLTGLRYIVRDSEGRTVYNSFSRITKREDIPLLEGKTVELTDTDSNEVIGTLTVYISRDFVEKEALTYMISMAKQRSLGGIIIVIVSFLVSYSLSQRIYKPIRALTSAADRISRRENSPPLPVISSDELGDMSQAFNRMLISQDKQRLLRKILVRNISHDLCTPLNNINLEAKGLQDDLTSGRTAAGHIIEEVEKINNLIQDLERLSRTDSGELKLNREPCSLVDVAREEVQRWQLKAKSEDISLIMYHTGQYLPLIQADPLRLSRALGNVIDNCIKYTPGGGRITVEVEKGEKQLILSVCDTGPGIEEEHLSHIFESFFRTDSGVERSGRGLGLSIAKEIVELHKGTVEAISEKGKGSRFNFTFPL